MAHHSRHQASRRVTPKREDNQRADAMARWLRAGAVAAGMGAAMAMGAGVASADTDGSDTSTSAGSESSSAGPSASNVSAAVGSDQSNDTAGPDADAKPAKVSTRPGTPRIRTSVSAQGTVRTPSNRDKPEAEPPTPDTATNSAAEVDATADESAQPADQVATPDGVDADLIDEIAVDEVSEGPREPSATKSNRSPAASSIRAEITAVARNITAAARKATADVVSGPVNESASTSITETARDAMAPASSLSAAAVTAEPTTTATAAQTEPAYPAAITAPVTLRAMVSDVLRWLGLPALSVGSPIPPIAVPAPLDKVWIALRRFEYRFFNDYPTAQPGQTSQSTTDTGVVTGSLNATDPDGDQ
ncbi:MAG TPA: hypothetical protein VFL67_08495, partial [Mycobacterium sp.]|nr:hypothetical protein [Mycobacterium sp.]